MATMPLVITGPGKNPTRSYPDDAGLDLYVHLQGETDEETLDFSGSVDGLGEDRDGFYLEIKSGSFVDVPCGLRVALRDGHWGLVIGRSSTIRKRGLLVYPGIIDTGYRGWLFAGVWNLTSDPIRVREQERLAQLIIFENRTQVFMPQSVRPDTFPASARGENGLGSTGL